MDDRGNNMDWRGTSRMHERGVVLVTVLAVLVALMVVSVAGARLALDDERSAQHERDRQLAFQAAEAALDDSLFNLGQALVTPPDASRPPAWQTVDLADSQNSHAYGAFSPALMAFGEGDLPVHRPGFIVEHLALAGLPGDASYYRVTAVGFGRNPDMLVVVQSIVKVTAANKKLRLSWREISNWRELHDDIR